MDDDQEPIIIDNGSGFIKAGFADDEAPKYVFPTVIGEPKAPGILVGMDQKPFYIGNDALSKKQFLNMSEPVQQGVIVNFDHMEQVWDQLLNQEMRINPDLFKFFVTETPKNPDKNKEKTVQIFFEKYTVPKFYMQTQAVLSLFASGMTTGTVVDCGDSISHTVPIYEGYAIPHAIQQIPLAGRHLTQRLQVLLEEKGISFSSSSNNREYLTKIKEQECFVSQDFDASMKQAIETNNINKVFNLASQTITLSTERIKCPELLFQPTQGGLDIEGIQKSTTDSIMKCDSDIRKDLFKGIVLAGGSTMFDGMRDKMEKEIKAMAPSSLEPAVLAPADRKFSCWLGAAILSKIQSFDNIWIPKKEYDDEGVNIVHKKCF